MSSEQYGFVFSVVFIIIFSALLASVPIGFLGSEETPEMVTPIKPSLVSGFSSTADFNQSDLSAYGQYVYTLGGKEWVFTEYATVITLGAKVLIGGVLWLGQLDSCTFVSETGADRGGTLTFAEIDLDTDNGTATYSLYSIGSGLSMGGFIFYYNSTEYADITEAWASYEVYMLHGVGFEESATANIGSLIVSLLLLQLPDVPVLVNILIAVPIWAGIVFIIWFIIKEMIPFV